MEPSSQPDIVAGHGRAPEVASFTHVEQRRGADATVSATTSTGSLPNIRAGADLKQQAEAARQFVAEFP
jgi:hypothetical protein